MPEIKPYCLLALSHPSWPCLLRLWHSANYISHLPAGFLQVLLIEAIDEDGKAEREEWDLLLSHLLFPLVQPQQWPLMLEAVGLVPAFLWHSWNHPHWQCSTLGDPHSELLSHWHQLGSTPSSQVWGPTLQSRCSTLLYSDNCSLLTFSLKTSRRRQLLPGVIISASPWGSLCLFISWMSI